MKTGSLLRLEPNGTALNNSIPENEQPNKTNIDDILENVFQEPIMNEKNKISKMKQNFQDGKITTDEYNIELKNLKDRLVEIVKKMNIMRNNIKIQDKNIENQSINSSIVIRNTKNNIEDNIE